MVNVSTHGQHQRPWSKYLLGYPTHSKPHTGWEQQPIQGATHGGDAARGTCANAANAEGAGNPAAA